MNENEVFDRIHKLLEIVKGVSVVHPGGGLSAIAGMAMKELMAINEHIIEANRPKPGPLPPPQPGIPTGQNPSLEAQARGEERKRRLAENPDLINDPNFIREFGLTPNESSPSEPNPRPMPTADLSPSSEPYKASGPGSVPRAIPANQIDREPGFSREPGFGGDPTEYNQPYDNRPDEPTSEPELPLERRI